MMPGRPQDANSPTPIKTAAVTGAAGGLGSCFAKKLAERGYHLILIDRNEDKLKQLCEDLATQHNIVAAPAVVDLTDDESVETLARHLANTATLELLVNNAGFGVAKYFVDADVERHLDMIRVHVMAAVRLTHAVLPGMIERDSGAVINVSSLNAWSPCAGVVSYSSTKAYVTVFGQALYDELRDTNVRIQTLCPGFVRTEFHDTNDMKGFDPQQLPAWMWMMPDDVVEYSLKNLARRKAIVIPGWTNRLMGRCMRMPLFQPLVRAVVRQDRTP